MRLINMKKFYWVNKLPIEEQNLYGKAIVEMSLKSGQDFSSLLNLENKKRQEVEKLLLQKYFVEVVLTKKIKAWVKNKCIIKRIDYFIGYNNYITITIYYSKNKDLIFNKESGLTKLLKEQCINILDEEGYFKIFPRGSYELMGCTYEKCAIEFDSCERINRECKGNYNWRYR